MGARVENPLLQLCILLVLKFSQVYAGKAWKWRSCADLSPALTGQPKDTSLVSPWKCNHCLGGGQAALATGWQPNTG